MNDRPYYQLVRTTAIIIIVSLPFDVDLDSLTPFTACISGSFRSAWSNTAISRIDRIVRIPDSAFFILGGLGLVVIHLPRLFRVHSHTRTGVCVRVDGDDWVCTAVGREDMWSGVGRTGVRVSMRSGCVCRLTTVEGSAMREGAADGEDDTEGHGCGKDSGHGGDDCLNGIRLVGGLSDEPEEHVDHVNDEDRSVEVKAITKHELPIAKLLNTEGLETPRESEYEGTREEDRGDEPVDSDELPIVVLRSCDTTLPRVERWGG